MKVIPPWCPPHRWGFSGNMPERKAASGCRKRGFAHPCNGVKKQCVGKKSCVWKPSRSPKQSGPSLSQPPYQSPANQTSRLPSCRESQKASGQAGESFPFGQNWLNWQKPHPPHRHPLARNTPNASACRGKPEGNSSPRQFPVRSRLPLLHESPAMPRPCVKFRIWF